MVLLMLRIQEIQTEIKQQERDLTGLNRQIFNQYETQLTLNL
jgi:hypothetical protein